MQTTTSLRRTAALAGLTAVAAAAMPAAGASAATFDNVRVIAPGATLPLDFPGYREPASNKLAANHRIVAVDATIGRDEKASRIITVPKGFRILTLGIAGDHLGGRAENDYVGKRSVRLTLSADRSDIAAGQSAHSTIYVLARRA